MNKTSPSPATSPTKEPTTFFSLPRELRQQVLKYTYADCKYLWASNTEKGSVKKWSQVLGQVDDRLHEDIQFLAQREAKALWVSACYGVAVIEKIETETWYPLL